MSLTEVAQYIYLGYTIFTLFQLRYTASILSCKSVARFRSWGYARRCSEYFHLFLSFLLISWCMAVPAELSVMYGSGLLVVLYL